MNTVVLQEKQQSPARPAGSWRLQARRALTLAPAADGLLRVAQGSLWATFDGPHPPLGVRNGDLVVEQGETLFVAAGERLVIESARRGSDAFFHWEPVPEVRALPVERWRAVALPWAELRTALGATAMAAVHLVKALAIAALASLPRRFPAPRVPA